jgi:hypothetical protein
MHKKRFQTRRATRLTESGQRAPARYAEEVDKAMFKIASLRCKMFGAKFGRYPGLDDPLFFDSKSDHPIVASVSEMHAQLMDAAMATRSDYASVMKFLGLG